MKQGGNWSGTRGLKIYVHAYLSGEGKEFKIKLIEEMLKGIARLPYGDAREGNEGRLIWLNLIADSEDSSTELMDLMDLVMSSEDVQGDSRVTSGTELEARVKTLELGSSMLEGESKEGEFLINSLGDILELDEAISGELLLPLGGLHILPLSSPESLVRFLEDSRVFRYAESMGHRLLFPFPIIGKGSTMRGLGMLREVDVFLLIAFGVKGLRRFLRSIWVDNRLVELLREVQETDDIRSAVLGPFSLYYPRYVGYFSKYNSVQLESGCCRGYERAASYLSRVVLSVVEERLAGGEAGYLDRMYDKAYFMGEEVKEVRLNLLSLDMSPYGLSFPIMGLTTSREDYLFFPPIEIEYSSQQLVF